MPVDRTFNECLTVWISKDKMREFRSLYSWHGAISRTLEDAIDKAIMSGRDREFKKNLNAALFSKPTPERKIENASKPNTSGRTETEIRSTRSERNEQGRGTRVHTVTKKRK